MKLLKMENLVSEAEQNTNHFRSYGFLKYQKKIRLHAMLFFLMTPFFEKGPTPKGIESANCEEWCTNFQKQIKIFI